MLYQKIIKPTLFKFDPESIHDKIVNASCLLKNDSLYKTFRSSFCFEDKRLEQTICGVTFKNPIGLAAGFDKNGDALRLFAALGFGCIEIGTVTPKAQIGNPKPRIFRFPREESLVNSMGFPSKGVSYVQNSLSQFCATFKGQKPVLGINIGKNKETSNELAANDYNYCLKELARFADYITLNISSPNTPDLRQLQNKEHFKELICCVNSEMNELNLTHKLPLFIKIAPDIAEDTLESLVSVAIEHKVSGIITSNTTIDKSSLPDAANLQGGLSGRKLFNRSLQLTRRVVKLSSGQLAVVGVGGIFSTKDALDFLRAGASLIQLYTGLVYEGPTLVKSINKGIATELENLGCSSISEIIGKES
jgi:dihydroorotate dehydrogenase